MFRSFLIMAATFHNPIVDDIKLVRVACIGDSITYGHGTVDDDHNEKMKESTPSTSIFPTCEGKVVEIDGKKYKLTLA